MFKENGCTPFPWPPKSYALQGSDQIFYDLATWRPKGHSSTWERPNSRSPWLPCFSPVPHLGGPWLATHSQRGKTSQWILLRTPSATRAPSSLQELPTKPMQIVLRQPTAGGILGENPARLTALCSWRGPQLHWSSLYHVNFLLNIENSLPEILYLNCHLILTRMGAVIHLEKTEKICSHNDQVPLTSGFALKRLDGGYLCIYFDTTVTQGSLAVQRCSPGMQPLCLVESI